MSDDIHEITANWLTAKCETGEPRVEVVWDKVICRNKSSGEIEDEYEFLGYNQHRFTFFIRCPGKPKCGWLHKDGEIR